MRTGQTNAYTTTRPDVCALVPPAAIDILDVGCSNGALGASLIMSNPGRRVTGIEYHTGFIDEASHRLHRVVQADLESFDWRLLDSEQFDCIVFADVLEHLRNPERALTDALPCLRRGGHVVISMPNIRHFSALWSIAIAGTFPRRDRGIFDRTHLRWFTLADARSLLREHGLVVEAESFSLRLGDQGGGRWNRLLRRLLDPVAGIGPIREFLTYQFCIRATKAD